MGLILARGGSKGLKKKNLATVNGRTLLARSLQTMKQFGSKCADSQYCRVRILLINT